MSDSESITEAARLNDTTKGFIYNTARRHHWRVASWIDLPDLIQEGYVCHAKCVKAYGTTIHEPAHFRALLKTAFIRRITTLAQQRTEAYGGELQIDDTNSGAPFTHDTDARLLLMKAPEEIKQLVMLIVGDVNGGFKRTKYLRAKVRETTNEYFCRLLGLNPQSVDMAGKVKEYFNR